MTPFVDKITAVDLQLSAAGVEHAFGGAICLGFHVESPRATADIDVNITADPGTGRQVLAALPSEVVWDESDVAQIARSGQARVFWDRTPLDLFFRQHALHGVVASRVQHVAFAGRQLPILSATDLAIFKSLCDRPRDWADIAAMLEYGQVDVVEVRRWLTTLVGAEDQRGRRFEELARTTPLA